MRSVVLPVEKLQWDVILGTLLGDGSLEFNGYRGTRLQIKQTENHKDYVFWMYCVLKNLCRTPPQQRKDTLQWYFSTRALLAFTDLRQQFYRRRKKVLPGDIQKILTSPISLAVWYMDDGGLDYRVKDHYAVTLHTDSFTEKEVRVLERVLWQNFQVSSRPFRSYCRGKAYTKLYIGASGRKRFFELVSPYVRQCFVSKLPPTFTHDPSETEPVKVR